MLIGVVAVSIIFLSHWSGVQTCVSERLNADICTILGKTTWEWLDLLIAPAVLALFGILSKEYL